MKELKLIVDRLITPVQAGKVGLIKQHYEDLQALKNNLEKLINSLSGAYQEEIDLLLTVPSVKSDFTAIAIISEMGVNMDGFPTAKHLCSWAALTTTNNESAGKKKPVRVSRATAT